MRPVRTIIIQCLVIICFTADCSCNANQIETAKVDGGTIIFNGNRIPNNGLVRDLNTSNDNKMIVYINDIYVASTGGTYSSVILYDSEKKRKTTLVGRLSKSAQYKCRDGNEFLNPDNPGNKERKLYFAPIFSPYDDKVLFSCPYWATSSAINIVDIATRETKFFKSGNALNFVRDGELGGSLIIQQHRYGGPGEGSHDYYYLFDMDGKEIGLAGKTTDEVCLYLSSHGSSIPKKFDCEKDHREYEAYLAKQRAKKARSELAQKDTPNLCQGIEPKFAEAAIDLINASGYRCARLLSMCGHFSDSGYVVRCDKYSFDLQPNGGKWQATPRN